MKRTSFLTFLVALAIALWAPSANAAFGLKSFDVTFTNQNGSVVTQAGAHPFAMTTSFAVNTKPEEGMAFEVPDEAFKAATFLQIPGLVGNPTAVPRCSTLDFLTKVGNIPQCSSATAVGVAENTIIEPTETAVDAVFNLEPPPGVAAKLGFWGLNTVPVTIEVGVSEDYPYNIEARLQNISQVVPFYASNFTLWGNPADPAHDAERGYCFGTCPANVAVKPFLTVPRACEGPLQTTYEAVSWENPASPISGSATTHDSSGQPLGFLGCNKLRFNPEITAQPTTASAESPSGLDFTLGVNDEGLVNPEGLANSEIKKAVVTLPEGVTANPSLAEGLGVCTQAQYAEEKRVAVPGQGCPSTSKIGTLTVKTPLLEGRTLAGSLYIAKPHENPFNSLIALYMVFRSPELGIVLKQAAKVEPDPETGQLVTTVDDIPQLPFSEFKLHFREGGRSPLVTPPSCGPHTAVARFTPWANQSTSLTTTSTFQITSGVGGGGCPPGGTPPFEPGFSAGTSSNSAATYSPFQMRLTRRDGDQDLTRFDATLPPGVTAKLVGVSQCPQSQIEAAKRRAGFAELASPSCPPSSEIGNVEAGAGVGSTLTYVPGKLYLAGPFNGAPISVVAIVPAVAGPFDVGTVVTQEALVIDPKTALVKADGAASDPIPHILAGIPLKVRDVRVNVDRPDFTLNPTSCDPSESRAQLWGGGADPFSTSDNSPFTLAARFQAANCSRLGFKPRLSLRLKGGTKRGQNPALTAVLRPRPGNANIAFASATLPRSEFLDQGHIRTVCTRVQFAASSCPPGSIYGRASAITPLLEEPVQGPVYLRSSDNLLPDLVADLRGPASLPIRFELVGRTDSIKGALRNTFDVAPDVPVSKFVLRLQGGRKGLLVNSTDICRGPHRAKIVFDAHNGKRVVNRPRLKAPCGR